MEQSNSSESSSSESNESWEKTVKKPESNPMKKRSAQWYPQYHRPHVIDIEIEAPNPGFNGYDGYDGYGGYGGYGRPPIDVDIVVDEENYGRPPYYGGMY